MKTNHNDKKKALAFKLRLEGNSYNEIRRRLGIKSKGTLSYWFKDLVLTPQAKTLLKKKMDIAQSKGFFKFNKARSENIKAENEEIYKESIKEISKLSRRDLFIMGISLYWGEGTKIRNSTKVYGMEISNADPYLIGAFLYFVRNVLKIDESKIKAGVQIHDNISALDAKNFWAKITNLPSNIFFIKKQISSAGKFKRPKRFLPYGTAIIKINGRQSAYEMKGYIDGLSSSLKGM